MSKRVVRVHFGEGKPFWGKNKALTEKLRKVHGTDGAFNLMEQIAPYADEIAKITVSARASRSGKFPRTTGPSAHQTRCDASMRKGRQSGQTFKEWLIGAQSGSMDGISSVKPDVRRSKRTGKDVEVFVIYLESFGEAARGTKKVGYSTLYGWWAEAGKKKRRK